jgi:hypothetical protein
VFDVAAWGATRTHVDSEHSRRQDR